MKKFFTLALAAMAVLSGSAAIPAKGIKAGAALPADMTTKHAKKGVYASKLKASKPMKAEGDEEETPDPIVLDTPTGVTITPNAQGELEVKWPAVNGANYYVAEGSMVEAVAAGTNYTLGDADFTGIQSTGTLEAPEESEYLTDTDKQLPGTVFYLPNYINGAIGVADNWLYAYIYGAYASVESGLYNLSIAKDNKLYVSMEVASGNGSDLYCELYTWDETAGEYTCADSKTEAALGTDFKTVTFELTGTSEECFFTIYPFGDPDTYEFDGNIFFRSLKVWVVAGEEGEIVVPVLAWEGEETTATIDKELVKGGNTYAAAVKAYQLTDEGDITGESEYSDEAYYNAPAGIEDVAVDATDAKAVYYNLQGIRLERPEGICIEVLGGQAKKVVK